MSAGERAKFRSDFTVEVTDHMGDDLTPLRAARVSTKGADSRTAEEALHREFALARRILGDDA